MKIPLTLLLSFWLMAGVRAESPSFPAEFPERAAAEILSHYRDYGTGWEFTLSLGAPRLASIKKEAVFQKDQYGKVYWAAKYTTMIHGVRASDSTGSYGVVLSDGEEYFTMSESALLWVAEEKSRPNQRLQGTPASTPSSSTVPEARLP